MNRLRKFWLVWRHGPVLLAQLDAFGNALMPWKRPNDTPGTRLQIMVKERDDAVQTLHAIRAHPTSVGTYAYHAADRFLSSLPSPQSPEPQGVVLTPH